MTNATARQADWATVRTLIQRTGAQPQIVAALAERELQDSTCSQERYAVRAARGQILEQIAQAEGVSRQAVHLSLRRVHAGLYGATRQLEDQRQALARQEQALAWSREHLGESPHTLEKAHGWNSGEGIRALGERAVLHPRYSADRPVREQGCTPEQIAGQLLKCYAELGRPFSGAEYDNWARRRGFCLSETVRRRCGPWNETLSALGIPVANPRSGFRVNRVERNREDALAAAAEAVLVLRDWDEKRMAAYLRSKPELVQARVIRMVVPRTELKETIITALAAHFDGGPTPSWLDRALRSTGRI